MDSCVIPTSLRAVLARRFDQIPSSDWQLSSISGLSGFNWRAENSDGVTILLRPDSRQKRQLGIRRQYEHQLLRCPLLHKLAPRSLGLIDGWLILEWLPGHISSGPLADKTWTELVSLMVQLHSLPLILPTRNLVQHCASYWRQCDRQRLNQRAWRVYQRGSRSFRIKPLKMAPLHMDVHPGNLVHSPDGLKLIDWEYAAAGDIALDLAVLTRGFAWDKTQRQHFIASYCAAGGYRDEVRLNRQVECWLPQVDYMAWLWYEVRWQQSRHDEFRRQANCLLAQF